MTRRGIFPSPTVTKWLRSIGIQDFNSSKNKKSVKGYVDPERFNQFERLRPQWENMMHGKEYPIAIGFHQVRNSKRLYDFGNSVELLQDLLTAHDFIVDDNVSYVFPVPMTKDGKLINEYNIRTEKWYSVDKENPGCFIKIF